MNEHHVIDHEGTHAVIESLDDPLAMLRLDDARLVIVPRSALVEQPDGNYQLMFSLMRFQQEGVIVLPVTEELLQVDKREIERTVRITKTVHTQDVTVDEPLLREDIDVERIMINRYVEGPQAVRYEGEITIIPLVEEVLVVEKKLLLREEIRISRQQKTISNPQAYTLRREDVQVEREDENTNL